MLGAALFCQTALTLLFRLQLGQPFPFGPFAALLLFPLAAQLLQPGLQRFLRLDQLGQLLFVILNRLLQLVAHLGPALLAGQQGLVMLLLFTQQGLQLAFGLFGGLLVFRQLVTGGTQRLDGFDARLVEVVVVVEGAA